VLFRSAGVSLDKLSSLLPASPRSNLCCAIPLPAVAVHDGVTLFYTIDKSSTSLVNIVRQVFDALGQCVCVATEKDMSKLPAISCMMGNYYMLLQTCTEWLEEQGVDRVTATRYVGCVMHSISRDGQLAALRETGEDEPQFQRLILEQTRGGYNEQAIRELTEAGMYAEIKCALSSINARWEGRLVPVKTLLPTSTTIITPSLTTTLPTPTTTVTTGCCGSRSKTNNNSENGKVVVSSKGKCPMHQPGVLVPLGLFVGYIAFVLFRPRKSL